MLTDLACKALITESKRINKPIKKSDGKGLLLHAFPNGSAYWYHKYSYAGRPKQLNYGSYPLISLIDARINHAESYKLLKSGIDPLQLRQDAAKEAIKEASRIEAENSRTFEVVACAWHRRNLAKWSEAHAKNIMRRLKKNLFPELAQLPIGQITRKQFLYVLREVERRSPSDARRCVQYADYIFNDALDEEYVSKNIASGITKSLAPQKHGHFASMDIDQLPQFLADLESYKKNLSEDRYDAISLLMFVAVRPNELVKAKWCEFDFNKAMWTVPGERMKMRDDHLVPLSKQALAILQKRWQANAAVDSPFPQSEFLFPSRRQANKPMSHNTICNIIIDMGWKGKHTGHGFRAFFMGVAKERLGYRHEVPNLQLAHKPKGSVDPAYDRARFLRERTELMQKYADYIEFFKKALDE